MKDFILIFVLITAFLFGFFFTDIIKFANAQEVDVTLDVQEVLQEIQEEVDEEINDKEIKAQDNDNQKIIDQLLQDIEITDELLIEKARIQREFNYAYELLN